MADFMKTCRDRWQHATSLAKEALCSSQANMKKKWYDRKAVKRHFQPGDKVLVLLPVPGSALSACFAGPYVIVRKVFKTDCVISTPECRRKTGLCHINMLKPCHDRETRELLADTATQSSVPAAVLSVEARADDDLCVLSEGQVWAVGEFGLFNRCNCRFASYFPFMVQRCAWPTALLPFSLWGCTLVY